jgi:predicted metal-binding membrane protein
VSEAQPGATAAVLTATLGLAAAAWVVSVRQMQGMDMGVSTTLGSFRFFVPVWITMMAAMMLPGAVPALVRRARTGRSMLAVPQFAVSYLAVWTAVGLLVYALYDPHGTIVAGAFVVAAGVYELTPLKRACRRRCRDSAGSGSAFGLCCIGSSIGLMVVLLALGAMSVTWMVVVAALVVAQKILPPRALLDVPLALALVVLGVVIAAAPSAIPGTT